MMTAYKVNAKKPITKYITISIILGKNILNKIQWFLIVYLFFSLILNKTIKTKTVDNCIDIAKLVLQNEIQELQKIEANFNEEFLQLISIINNCKGNVIISGVGKSGIIGQKISSIFCSIGITSFFINPMNATHGDNGCLKQKDIVIIISYSGNTEELKNILIYCKKNNIKTILITCNKKCILKDYCNLPIFLNVQKEAIQGFPIPTTSSIAMLSFFDAITACLVKKKNLTLEQYRKYHPSGNPKKAD